MSTTISSAGTTAISASLSGVTSAAVALTVAGASDPSQLPTVTSLAPTSGPSTGGTQVTITGTHLTDPTAVHFGAVAATVVDVVSDTQIVAIAPQGAAGTVNVTVSTPRGTSAASTGSAYTYVAVPAVTMVTPAAGPQAGGASITIVGTSFTGATAVRVGGHAAASFTVDADTKITAVTPSGVGAAYVTVTTPTGTSATGPGSAYAYLPPPVVRQVAPGNGPVAGGNPVIITGEHLESTTEVRFGATTATFELDSPTQVTATAPPGAGIVQVTLHTPGGTSDPIDYAYLEIPALTALAPLAGPMAGGNQVTLTGTGLEAATHVDFGEQPATSFQVVSPTEIVAFAPAGTGTVQVRVTTPVGHSNGIGYRFAPVPTVASAAPTTGPEAGGNPITLTGTGFFGASAVAFGAAPATAVEVESDTILTAIVPAGSGTVPVTVTTPGGESAPASYQYAPIPSLAGVSPRWIPQGGGTLVTLTGTGLRDATAVHFGATPGTDLTVFSDTQVSVLAPAGSGAAEVTVATPGGTSNAVPIDFAPPPTITSLAPAAGPEPGGYPLVITGTSFVGATGVKFGAVDASGITVQSPTELTALVPPGTGTAQVTVIAAGGTSDPQPYTYVPGPAVSSLLPIRGPVAGGTSVSILGSFFTGASAVRFGATPATSFTVVSDGELTAVAPAGTDTVDVTVVTVGGVSNAAPYTFVELPDVTNLTPPKGPLIGGNWVTLTGTDLPLATEVHFGAIPANDFTLVSATEIHAQAPPGTGTVDVTVTTAGGTSDGLPYTYVAPATLATLHPSAGPTAGGQTVVLTGTGFSDAIGVVFGSTPAASFTVDSDLQITAVTPPGVSTVNVHVTTQFGESNVLPYTFIAPTAVTSASPMSGPTTGGTLVNLGGVGFTGATAVTFGEVPATSFTVVSNSLITATAPPGTAGATTIAVTSPAGTGTNGSVFTYVAVPQLISVTPNARTVGPLGDYTSMPVTIVGTNLSSITAISFWCGGLSYMQGVSRMIDRSDTMIQIYSTPPVAGAPCSGTINASSPTGQSNHISFSWY